MPHVLRDQDGRIMAIFDRPSCGATEEAAASDPELLAFLEGGSQPPEEAQQTFLRSDLDFIRVLEDLLGALMERNVLTISDLPTDAQRKVLGRATLRQMLSSHMPLIGTEESETIF